MLSFRDTIIKTLLGESFQLYEGIELGSKEHTAVYHGGSEEIAKHLFRKHSGRDISDKDINQDYKQSKQPLANRIMFGPAHKEIHSEYKRLQKTNQ